MKLSIFASTITSLVAGVSAHPGHDITAEAIERREFISRSTNLQVKCGKHLEARGINQRAIDRREALAKSFREKRGISEQPYFRRRDVDSVLTTDHHSNLTGIDFESSPDDLFGDQSSCLLQEEATEGPYYVSGEYVRENMTESQGGIPIVIDMQVIDINTCEPLTNQYVEFWHCNATGVYSGVSANGNGDSANDDSNLDATFLRGIQPTDDEGVVQMATIVPGHYTGRTTHVHIMTHGGTNSTVLPNNTLAGGTVSHVGQLFFDQDLLTEVNRVAPYSDNSQDITLNEDDSILAGEANSTDPVLYYVYVGESVADGLVTWITIGVDSSVSKTVQAAAYLDETGGHANENAGGPGGGGGGAGGPPSGGGGGGPGGAAPSGSAPFGAGPSGSAAPSGSAPAGSAATTGSGEAGSGVVDTAVSSSGSGSGSDATTAAAASSSSSSTTATANGAWSVRVPWVVEALVALIPIAV